MANPCDDSCRIARAVMYSAATLLLPLAISCDEPNDSCLWDPVLDVQIHVPTEDAEEVPVDSQAVLIWTPDEYYCLGDDWENAFQVQDIDLIHVESGNTVAELHQLLPQDGHQLRQQLPILDPETTYELWTRRGPMGQDLRSAFTTGTQRAAIPPSAEDTILTADFMIHEYNGDRWGILQLRGTNRHPTDVNFEIRQADSGVLLAAGRGSEAVSYPLRLEQPLEDMCAMLRYVNDAGLAGTPGPVACFPLVFEE